MYTPMSLSASLPAVIRDHDTDSDCGRSTPPLAGNVLALRNRWELEASRNRYLIVYLKNKLGQTG